MCKTNLPELQGEDIMPVIETSNMHVINKELKTVPFKRVIKFMKRTELFECAIPKDWADVVSEHHRSGTIYSDSFHGIEASWEQISRKFRKIIMSENKKKVIIVKFRATAFKHISGNPGTYSKEPVIQRNLNGISFAKDPTLHLSYELAYNIKGSYYAVNMNSMSGPDKTDIEVEWTEEREAFFEQAETGLREMIFRIEDFIKAIDEEPALLDKMIGKNLLGPGQEEQ